MGLVTGQRGMTHSGKGFAVFEVPESLNLIQFALEIRALKTHRVSDHEHYFRDVMIIPLRETG